MPDSMFSLFQLNSIEAMVLHTLHIIKCGGIGAIKLRTMLLHSYNLVETTKKRMRIYALYEMCDVYGV